MAFFMFTMTVNCKRNPSPWQVSDWRRALLPNLHCFLALTTMHDGFQGTRQLRCFNKFYCTTWIGQWIWDWIPLIIAFIETSGSNSIQKNDKNYSNVNKKKLYRDSHKYVNKRFNNCQGRKFDYITPNVLFMLLTVSKNEGTQDFLAAVFKVKSSPFQRIIAKFVEIFFDWAYDELVVSQS